MVIQNIIRAGNGGGGFDDDSSSSSSDSSSSSSSSLNPYENMNPILRIREDANPYQDGPYDDFGECPRVKCSRCKCWRKLRGFLCPEEDEDGNVVARPLEYSREFILMCQAGDRPITCEMLHREDECGENPDDRLDMGIEYLLLPRRREGNGEADGSEDEDDESESDYSTASRNAAEEGDGRNRKETEETTLFPGVKRISRAITDFHKFIDFQVVARGGGRQSLVQLACCGHACSPLPIHVWQSSELLPPIY